MRRKLSEVREAGKHRPVDYVNYGDKKIDCGNSTVDEVYVRRGFRRNKTKVKS